MTYKLIALDIDGTLITSEQHISPRTKAAIAKAKEQGVVFAIATGRMFRSALPFAEELGLDLPIIAYNGALVQNPRTHEVYVHYPIPLTVAKEIARRAKEEGLHLNAYIDDEVYVERITPEAEVYMQLSQYPVRPVGCPLDQFMTKPPTRLTLISLGNDARLRRFAAQVQEDLQERLYVLPFAPDYLELLHPAVSKGNALLKLAERLGILPEEVVAVGDGCNDMEMVQRAGLGVAMANADPALKEVADFITSSNDEDGVAEVIERFVLGG